MGNLNGKPKSIPVGGGMDAVNVGTRGHIDHGKERDLLLVGAMETYALEHFGAPELPVGIFKDEPSWQKLNKGRLSKKDRRK